MMTVSNIGVANKEENPIKGQEGSIQSEWGRTCIVLLTIYTYTGLASAGFGEPNNISSPTNILSNVSALVQFIYFVDSLFLLFKYFVSTLSLCYIINYLFVVKFQ